MSDIKITDLLFNNNISDDLIDTYKNINNATKVSELQKYYPNYISFEYSNYNNEDNNKMQLLYEENDFSYYNYFMIDNSSYYTSIIWYYLQIIIKYILAALIFYLFIKIIRKVFSKLETYFDFSNYKLKLLDANKDKNSVLRKIVAYVILIIILSYATYFLIF